MSDLGMGAGAGGLDAGFDAGFDAGELETLAVRIAHEAAELIRAGGTEGARHAVAATKSSPTDVVTAMDRAVEELLRARLHEQRPDDAVLGEEGGLAGGNRSSGLTWVLDPIDGTVNYLYGQPGFAVSVAVVTGDPTVAGAWQPVAGCVLQPVGGDYWRAARGCGAWFHAGGATGGSLLAMPEPPELGFALVATGFGYRRERRRGQARVVAELLPMIRDIRRVGSAAVDLCWVAQGKVDLYYERGTNVWDIAAAALVVAEAGGELRGLRAGPPGPAMTVAGADPLLSGLCDLLADLEADSDPAA